MLVPAVKLDTKTLVLPDKSLKELPDVALGILLMALAAPPQAVRQTPL